MTVTAIRLPRVNLFMRLLKRQKGMGIEMVQILDLSPMTQADIPALNKIYERVCDYFAFDPDRTPLPPADCLEKGDLPLGGKRENFVAQNIVRGNEIKGYVTHYKGYPDRMTAYLCFIYIAEQSSGYGSEAVRLLLKSLKNEGFRRVLCTVSLKNVAAVRFWHKMGFEHITKVDLKNQYAAIELEKIL